MGYWVRAGFDISETLDIVKDRLIALHVHDLDKLTKNGHDVPWGTGECNLEGIFEKLINEDIGPLFLGIEYAYNWGSSLPEVKQSKVFIDEVTIRLSK
jgi:sugar phosphate isomerase/epimerase